MKDCCIMPSGIEDFADLLVSVWLSGFSVNLTASHVHPRQHAAEPLRMPEPSIEGG
jgi:hypothetical protein